MSASTTELTLNHAEINSMIGSVNDAIADDNRYLDSVRHTLGEPAATDTCCPAHQAIYNRDRQTAEALLERIDLRIALLAKLYRGLADTKPEGPSND